MAANVTTISAERAFEIINMNKRGERPLTLNDAAEVKPTGPIDLAEQDSLTRFDKPKRKGNKDRNDKPHHNNEANEQRTTNEHRNNRGERRFKKRGHTEK
jgi:hypothetical protein